MRRSFGSGCTGSGGGKKQWRKDGVSSMPDILIVEDEKAMQGYYRALAYHKSYMFPYAVSPFMRRYNQLTSFCQ